MPKTYAAMIAPKIGATIMLATPESRTPKNTKPTPGLCAKGLPKSEIAINASSSARIVRAAPRDLFGTVSCFSASGELGAAARQDDRCQERDADADQDCSNRKVQGRPRLARIVDVVQNHVHDDPAGKDIRDRQGIPAHGPDAVGIGNQQEAEQRTHHGVGSAGQSMTQEDEADALAVRDRLGEIGNR